MQRMAVFLSMMLAGNLLADTPPGTGNESEVVPTTADKPPASRARKASKPKQTFTPSEKISADSAVSFPVDI